MRRALLNKHLTILVVGVCLCSASWLALAQSEDENLPQFFGVYVKMKDGTLIELSREKPFYYSSMERSGMNEMDRVEVATYLVGRSRAYYAKRPQASLRVSDIEGFYVYGNYAVTSFFLAIFVPPSKVHGPEWTLMRDENDGSGPIRSGGYVYAERGWNLETSFRHREEKPNLYWIVPRPEMDFTKYSESEDFILAVELDRAGFFPFTVAELPQPKISDQLPLSSLEDYPYEDSNRTLASGEAASTVAGSSAKFEPAMSEDGRFERDENGIVFEEKTGLEWFVGPDQDTNWYQAKEWVEGLKLGGSGWRMPTRQELQGLCQKEKQGRKMPDIDPLFTTTIWHAWSGERHKWASNIAFYVTFVGKSGSRQQAADDDGSKRRAFAVRARPY